MQNLRQMQTSTIDANDLERAKALLLREIPLSESSVDNIAQKFISNIDLNLPLDEPTIAAKHYMELNADDVLSAFKKWIRPNDLVQVTQGPAPQ